MRSLSPSCAACAAALLAANAGIAADPTAAGAAQEKTVLVISPEGQSLPVAATINQGIRSTLQAHSPRPILFYREYLDLSAFAGGNAEGLIARLMKEKYAGRKVDLVMPCGEAAIRFVLRERAAMFPGIPVVFCTANRESIRPAELAADVTGVTMFMDWAGTAELALRLHPGTRRLVFIGGSGPTAREWEAQARRALSAFANRVEVNYLTGLPMAELLKSVATLPQGTVGIFNAFIRDGSGRSFTTPEALDMVSSASNFPIYGVIESMLGHGLVGGPMIDFQAQGVMAAELGWRILGGERLGPADVVNRDTNTFVFDARQLQRWAVPEDRLPPGSIVRFRQPSIWGLYKWEIAAAIGLTALQTLLIVGLLLERRQRKRAERRLDERLRFETLLSDLAAGFIKIRSTEVARHIEDGLRRVVEELGVDRAAVGESVTGGQIRVTHSWTRPEVSSVPATLDPTRMPWSTGQIRAGRVVALSRPEDLPEEAALDRGTLQSLGIRSLVLVPLVLEEAVVGVMACSLLRDQRSWPKELLQRLRLLAEVFSLVLWRRRAQAALEESEGRFRVMADAAPVMIWLAGPDGGCVDFNREWLEFTGRTLAEELGDGWVEGVHPEDRDRCMNCYLGALVARQPFSIEYRLRRADGAWRTVLDRGVPRFGGDAGGFSGYIGSAVDITEVKTAEQSLVESIALRSAIFGSLYGEVVALSREGAILAVNEAWSRFAELSGGDPSSMAVGANYLAVCRRAAASGDSGAAKALKAIEGVLAGSADRALLEYPCQSPAGTRWFAMTVEPFKRPEGGVVISHLDITRRRRAEEEVELGREELAHALRVATLGELAATLAHEINQPLTAILSNAHATRRMLESPRLDRDEFGEALEDIAQDARRAAEIIRRLRTLFRKQHSDRRPLDVNEAIREVTSLLRKDLERKQVGLRLDLAEDLPRVMGDVVQLQQVFLNVVVNACDAMKGSENGPRELRIETSHRPAGLVAIDIRDSGKGVKESDLNHMFDRFVTTKPDGLGMGLSISRSIIDAHGGRIWATRNPDRGLTIHSELPSLPS
jgi:PAS domain S-box-containing protein